MYKLSYLIIFIFSVSIGFAQSPHGDGFKTDCAVCHNADSWKVTKADMTFDHSTTKFKLAGQHQTVDCKSCHQTLKFQEAKSECDACHTDMHTNTLGPDCARCHTPKSWIIENTKSMHQLSRFPLLGNHAVADCASCHKSSTNLKFEPLGIECVDCHKADYLATKTPNHLASNYSTNCTECHGVKSTGWTASNFDHGFFPLTEGHSISCVECHKSGTYQKISKECISCHQTNFNSTTNPNHNLAGFSISCIECHTTKPNWTPANYKQHDATFPIYSGNHKGEWEKCTDCHTTKNYAEFSCTTCHEHNQSETDSDHKGISSYNYKSVSCYACHPQGSKSGVFDHNATSFPLTGSHTAVDCASCHTTGYAGTSMECKSCHQAKYNTAQVPNHTAAGISVDCKTCHTATAWQPSSFKHATIGFELAGAHAAVVQCSSCHVGNTTSASSNCISCHQAQYNTAKGHVASKFPTDCTLCHNNNNWLGAVFNHSSTNFPLTGSHTTVDCASCHTTGYAGTSMECKSCHQANFNAAVNPNHQTLGLSVTCTDCHTTNPGWQPAKFPNHSNYFALTGAHATIANDCLACHKGTYTNTPKTCYACHTTDYNNTTNPAHSAAQFPTDCAQCHTVNAWEPSTFSHDSQYFPIYSGKHQGKWAKCSECHTSATNFAAFSCIICHEHNSKTSVDIDHQGVNGYAYNATSCYSCHLKGD